MLFGLLRKRDAKPKQQSGTAPKPPMPDIVGRDIQHLLKLEDALSHVEKVRGSASLASLRQDFANLFSGRRCVVIGSAPGAAIVNPSPEDRVICVNASGWLAKRAGIRAPDLTVVVGRTLDGEKPVRVASVEALSNLETDWLLFVEIAVAKDDAKAILHGAGMTFRHFSTVNSLERAAILGSAWQEEIEMGPGTNTRDRPSTGVFAASIAVWAGASEVVLCGFSLSGGHAYIQGDTPRNHIKGDRQFFTLARRLPCRIATTSPALSEEFGLTLTTN